MMKRFIFEVAVCCAACTGQAFDWASVTDTITVPAGEEVRAGEAQVSLLRTAKNIFIGEGGRLLVTGATTAFTNTATFTGSGEFRVASNTGLVSLGGDATAFTGEFYFTNAYIRVTSLTALGTTNKVTHWCRTTSTTRGPGWFCLDREGTYANEFHVNSSPSAIGNAYYCFGGLHESWMTAAEKPYNIYLTGDVYVDAGRPLIRFPQAKIYLQGGLYVRTATMNEYPFFANGNYIEAVRNDMGGRPFCDNVSCTYLKSSLTNCPLVLTGNGGGNAGLTLQAANLFERTTSLQMGNDGHYISRTNGTISISHDQVASNLTVYSESSLCKYAIIGSAAATMTFYGATPETGFPGALQGKASLMLDSSADGMFRFKKSPTQNNTTTGTLGVRKGTLTFDADVTFPKLTGLKVADTGILEVKSSATFPQTASLTMNGGTLKLAEGVVLTVKAMTNGTTVVRAGSYNKNQSHFTIEGEGQLVVLTDDGDPNYVWSGQAGNDDLADAANWFGGQAPTLNAPVANLIFTNAATVTVSDTIYVNDLKLVSDAPVTLTGGKIVLNGAIKATGYDGAAPAVPVTNVIASAIELPETGAATRTWNFGGNTMTRFTGALSGGRTNDTLVLEHASSSSRGAVELAGNNENLQIRLKANYLSEFVLSGKNALGAPSDAADTRYAEFVKDGNAHYYFTGDGLTNRVALKLSSAHGYTQREPAATTLKNRLLYSPVSAPFVQVANFYDSHSSATPNTMVWVNATFLGETRSPSGWQVGHDYMEAYQPETSWNTGVIDLKGRLNLGNGYLCTWNRPTSTIRFGACGNTWSRFILLSGVKIICDTNNTLAAEGQLQLARGNKVSTDFDLNGFDQAVERVCHQPHDTKPWIVTAEETKSVSMKSVAGPATLTVSPTSSVTTTSIKFTDHLGLTYAGAADAEWPVAIGKSTSDGDLRVTSGKLTFLWGAGWSGTNVVVSGGTLCISNNAGATAFGVAGQANRTVLRLVDTGRLELTTGETATVRALQVGNSYLKAGLYGGPDCADAAAQKLSIIAGGGVVRVLHGAPVPGFCISVR